MNWKNVLRMVSVYSKSSRAIRGERLRRYTESKVFPYLLYGGTCFLGLLIGLVVGNSYLHTIGLDFRSAVFPALPVVFLVFCLLFTMMRKIQRSGVKATTQITYWLPITWGEHTLASSLVNLLGIPLAGIVLVCSFVIGISFFLMEPILAVLTIFALLGSAYLASVTVEIFVILQRRLTGAAFKSSGESAVWVRFIGFVLLMVVFYLAWFSFTSGPSGSFVKAVTDLEETLWFIPYLWPGAAVAAFTRAPMMLFSFLAGSFLFILALFYGATKLNEKFGMYEPPAITISRGKYTPGRGILDKIGFSPLEASLIRKDFKAFTRRRELMGPLLVPLVSIIWPVMQGSGSVSFATLLLVPGSLSAVMLGSVILGSEGRAVRHFYSAPISARSLLKCKYAFVTFFSFGVLMVSTIVAIITSDFSLTLTLSFLPGAIFLIITLGMVSLRGGVSGADFTEVPRARLIRPLSALVNMVACMIVGLVVISPLALYGVSRISSTFSLASYSLYIAIILTSSIALVVTYIFFRITLKDLREFLRRAEI